jgi:hypothetical protein
VWLRTTWCHLSAPMRRYCVTSRSLTPFPEKRQFVSDLLAG